jgi:hypothetical protein
MITQYLLKLFVAYNILCIKTKIGIKNARKKYSAFDSVCRGFEYVWNLFVILFVHLTRNKTESSSAAWICSCKYLPEGNGLSALTIDTYLDFSQEELEYLPKTIKEFREIAQLKESEYNRIVLKQIRTTILTCDIDTNLIIAKICPFATVIQPANKIDPFFDLKTVHLSSLRFLEIEYSCGNLPAITIEIPNSHYIVDNQLLSKSYILRYLEHLPMYSNWIFNEHDYKVKIIDYDSNMVTIRGNQYILLEKDEYRVMNLDANIPPTEFAASIRLFTELARNELT